MVTVVQPRVNITEIDWKENRNIFLSFYYTNNVSYNIEIRLSKSELTVISVAKLMLKIQALKSR